MIEKNKPTLNFLDRTIGFFNPIAGLNRARARFVMDQIRKYEGASRTPRTRNWNATPGSANVEIIFSLKTLRDRSRDLVRNNPYAKKALQVISNNTIGAGIRPRVDKKGRNAKNISELWRKWGESVECDFDEIFSFYGLQKLIMHATAEGGNVLIRKRRVTDGVIPIRLQVVEGDLLDSSRSDNLENGGYIIHGIEFDANQRRVAYWVFDRHPNDVVFTNISSYRVPATDIIHVYACERPGQVLGVPFGVSSFIRLKDFDEYEDAQLTRQKIAACFAVFIHDSGEDLTGTISGTTKESDGSVSERVQPGLIEHLPPGKSVSFSSPPGTEGYGEYSKNVLRAVASAYGITYEALTGDLSKVNFSSGRMGWLEQQRQICDWQDNLIVPACNKLWKWFLEGALIAGYITKADVVASWTPPRREMIDPVKEIKAMSEEVRNGFTSWSDAVTSRAWDPDELLIELKKEAALFEEFKLMLACDPRFDANRKPPEIAGATKPTEPAGNSEKK